MGRVMEKDKKMNQNKKKKFRWGKGEREKKERKKRKQGLGGRRTVCLQWYLPAWVFFFLLFAFCFYCFYCWSFCLYLFLLFSYDCFSQLSFVTGVIFSRFLSFFISAFRASNLDIFKVTLGYWPILTYSSFTLLYRLSLIILPSIPTYLTLLLVVWRMWTLKDIRAWYNRTGRETGEKDERWEKRLRIEIRKTCINHMYLTDRCFVCLSVWQFLPHWMTCSVARAHHGQIDRTG